MPYSVSRPPKDLKKRIKKKYPKATKNDIRQFIHVFNSAYKKTKSESDAFAQAWGVLKKKKKSKKKSELISSLVKIANALDEKGFSSEASELDSLISSIVSVKYISPIR